MISSRCKDVFPLSSKSGVKLSDVRGKLKREVEASLVLGERPYEIWIHEKATEDAELDSWEGCLRQAREAEQSEALLRFAKKRKRGSQAPCTKRIA
jgi:hypothetical protein